MSGKQAKICVVGAGGMGNTHAQAFAGDPRAILAAVVDPDQPRAEKLAVAAGAVAYAQLGQALREHQPDVVTVCTPPALHEEPVLQALAAGCHVLCEKPLACRAAQATRMTAAARAAGRLLVTAFCHRFHEPVMQAREWIRAGRIGRVLQFRNRFAGLIPMEGKWFADPVMAGGGAILDTSIHSIDLFRYLVGDPVSVSARTATMVQRVDVEDSSIVLLQTADGAMGSIEACWSSPVSSSVIEVWGSEGTIVVEYADPCVARLRRADMPEWETAAMAGPDRFTLQARHLLDCVQGRREPLVTGDDGLWAARIADAAYESVAKQAWVGV